MQDSRNTSTIQVVIKRGGMGVITFEKVLEIFRDYLQEDPCTDVVYTKWGYVRLFCEPPHMNAMEAVLCQTPVELFRELLEIYLVDQEYQIVKRQGALDQENRKKLERVRKEFLDKMKKTENTEI